MLRFKPKEGTSEQANPFAALEPYVYRQEVFKTFSDDEVLCESGVEATELVVKDLESGLEDEPCLPPQQGFQEQDNGDGGRLCSSFVHGASDKGKGVDRSGYPKLFGAGAQLPASPLAERGWESELDEEQNPMHSSPPLGDEGEAWSTHLQQGSRGLIQSEDKGPSSSEVATKSAASSKNLLTSGLEGLVKEISLGMGQPEQDALLQGCKSGFISGFAT